MKYFKIIQDLIDHFRKKSEGGEDTKRYWIRCKNPTTFYKRYYPDIEQMYQHVNTKDQSSLEMNTIS